MKFLLGAVFASLLIFTLVSISYATDYPSSNKQLQQGVLPEDITCNENLVLLIKSDGNPACVKEDNVFRLLQSGWALKVISQKNESIDQKNNPQNKIDIWISQNAVTPPLERAPSTGQSPSVKGGNYLGGISSAPSISSEPHTMDDSIGFAVGGAQDINNFRENIENDFLPLHTDITYEGLFYDYYFDTGKTKECKKLFCPSYSYAISEDPFSNNDEYYLSVGLNSGLKESDFQRKKLNLVVVLDVSGSMGSEFNKYYYDSFGNQIIRDDDYTENDSKTKMELANQSVTGLLDHLNYNDNLGIVLFDNRAHVSKPL